MRASRLIAAALALVLAAVLALLAADVRTWRDTMRADDLRFQLSASSAADWDTSTLLPSGVARRVLDVDDDRSAQARHRRVSRGRPRARLRAVARARSGRGRARGRRREQRRALRTPRRRSTCSGSSPSATRRAGVARRRSSGASRRSTTPSAAIPGTPRRSTTSSSCFACSRPRESDAGRTPRQAREAAGGAAREPVRRGRAIDGYDQLHVPDPARRPARAGRRAAARRAPARGATSRGCPGAASARAAPRRRAARDDRRAGSRARAARARRGAACASCAQDGERPNRRRGDVRPRHVAVDARLGGAGQPSRLARAQRAAVRLRAAIDDVPAGVGTLTDRALPNLLPERRHRGVRRDRRARGRDRAPASAGGQRQRDDASRR